MARQCAFKLGQIDNLCATFPKLSSPVICRMPSSSSAPMEAIAGTGSSAFQTPTDSGMLFMTTVQLWETAISQIEKGNTQQSWWQRLDHMLMGNGMEGDCADVFAIAAQQHKVGNPYLHILEGDSRTRKFHEQMLREKKVADSLKGERLNVFRNADGATLQTASGINQFLKGGVSLSGDSRVRRPTPARPGRSVVSGKAIQLAERTQQSPMEGATDGPLRPLEVYGSEDDWGKFLPQGRYMIWMDHRSLKGEQSILHVFADGRSTVGDVSREIAAWIRENTGSYSEPFRAQTCRYSFML